MQLTAEEAGDPFGAETAGYSARVASIAELGRRALTGAAVDELMASAVVDVGHMLGVDRSAVLMAGESELRCEAAVGWPTSEITAVPLSVRSHLAHVCISQEPVVVSDLATDPRFADSRHLVELGLVSAAGVPVRGGVERALGVLAVHSSEPREFGPDDIVYLRAVANVLAAAIGRARVEEISRRSQERLRFLAEASRTLSVSLNYNETLAHVTELAVPELADWCTVELELDGAPRTVAVAHADPKRERWTLELRKRYLPITSPGVPASGAIYPELTDEVLAGHARDEADLEVLRALGMSSVMVVPLLTGEHRLGVINFVRAESGGRYDDDDLAFARALARRAAVAVENATLHDASIRAAEQVRRLQEATAELAEATTPQQIARAIVSSGAASVGASAAWVAELSADGKSLQMLANLGYEAVRAEAYESIPLVEHNPTTDALSRQETLFFRTAAEFRALYPDVPYTRYEAMVVMPAIVGSTSIGVLALNFLEEQAFDDEDRRLLDSLAKLYAQSLERAKLYVASQQREWTASILARLGEAVERATTVSRRAARATSLLVSEFAGLAAIDLLDDEQQPRRISFDRRDQWPSTLLEAEARVAHRAFLSGEAQHAPLPRSDASPPGMLHALPLRARGRTIGVLVVGSFFDRSRYDVDDAGWLADVAGRIALSLDNARLYENEHSASHALQLGLLGGALPILPGAKLEAAYKPGTLLNEVGGDWYDAFALPDGRLAVLVGDVAGHDLRAALAMGELRAAVRAVAKLGGPADLMHRLDEFIESFEGAEMTTLAYVEIDPSGSSVRYGCAGHPPPLVLSASGEPRFLWDGRSTPLGSRPREARSEASAALLAGETLVLYTDGLIERKRETLTAGLERLSDAVRGAQRDPLSRLKERILATMLSNHAQEDDFCLILARPDPA